MKVEAAIHAVPNPLSNLSALRLAPPLAGVASMTLAASDLELPLSVC